MKRFLALATMAAALGVASANVAPGQIIIAVDTTTTCASDPNACAVCPTSGPTGGPVTPDPGSIWSIVSGYLTFETIGGLLTGLFIL